MNWMTVAALLQDTDSSGSPDSSNVVLYVSAMTSFVAFVGVIVNGYVQRSASRDAVTAAREAREAAKEAAVIAATTATEARSTATEQQKTLANVEHLVNSKSDQQAAVIRELTAKIDALNAAALAKAEAAPPVGSTPMSTPTATIPVKVVVVDTEKPIDVIDKTPNKGEK